MLTLHPPAHEAPALEPEVVVREARRRQHRRWMVRALALCLAGGLVAGVVLATGSPPPPAAPHARGSGHQPGSSLASSVSHHVSVPFGSSASCPATPTGPTFTASPNGTFASCLRVGPLASGTYHVVVTGYPTVPRYTVRSRLAPPKTRVHLIIRPTRGGPGTRVTVEATLAAPGRTTTTYGAVCWDGCADGLQYTTAKHWTSPTTFVEHFRVPAAPWVVASRVKKYRIAPLASGNYQVGVDCIVVSKGCGATEGSAVFHLVVPRSARRQLCTSPTPSTCVYLQLRRGSAMPGQAVRVRGFAPFTSNLIRLEVVPGEAKGPAVALRREPTGGFSLRYGQADLVIRPAPTFSSLGRLAVLGEQSDGSTPVSVNPAAPSRIAWCGQGMVGLTDSTGTALGSVSTAGVASSISDAGIGYGLYPETARCDDVALPSAGPALFAAFSVAVTPTRTVGAYIPLETTDGGGSWTLVPPPPGAHVTGFGGFHYQDGRVVALYTTPAQTAARGGDPAKVTLPIAETFDTATSTWAASSLQCPKRQPCTTFGSAPPGNCAMNGTVQWVLLSADGGKSWRAPTWPSNVDGCTSSSLVATGPSSELLVNSSSSYPMLRSTDGGKHWSDVALPTLPFTIGGLGPDVTILPDGAVLAIKAGEPVDWVLLRPERTRWCAVSSVPATVRTSVGMSSPALFGTALWWVSGARSSTQPAALEHVDVSGIRC